MPGVVNIPISNLAIGSAEADMDIWSVGVAANKILVVEGLELFNAGDDYGDTAEQALRFFIGMGNTTVGSGGSDTEPVALRPGVTEDFAAHRTGDTTPASAGTLSTLWRASWNIRMPFDKVWTPETKIWVRAGSATTYFVVRLAAAPGADLNVDGNLYLQTF